MKDEELRQHIQLGEQRGVEFKSPGDVQDKVLLARVIRGIIAMSNTRDGGLVIIGVTEQNGVATPVGVSAGHLAGWTRDKLGDKVARYAMPGIEFHLEQVILDGNTFIVISVPEFPEIPTLCTQDFHDPGQNSKLLLREGALYVRPRRKPESVEVRTTEDMRELMDLATDKAIQKFVRRAQYAQIMSAAGAPQAPADKFENELGDMK